MDEQLIPNTDAAFLHCESDGLDPELDPSRVDGLRRRAEVRECTVLPFVSFVFRSPKMGLPIRVEPCMVERDAPLGGGAR